MHVFIKQLIVARKVGHEFDSRVLCGLCTLVLCHGLFCAGYPASSYQICSQWTNWQIWLFPLKEQLGPYSPRKKNTRGTKKKNLFDIANEIRLHATFVLFFMPLRYIIYLASYNFHRPEAVGICATASFLAWVWVKGSARHLTHAIWQSGDWHLHQHYHTWRARSQKCSRVARAKFALLTYFGACLHLLIVSEKAFIDTM